MGFPLFRPGDLAVITLGLLRWRKRNQTAERTRQMRTKVPAAAPMMSLVLPPDPVFHSEKATQQRRCHQTINSPLLMCIVIHHGTQTTKKC
jgi:hypothetical protein